MRCGARCARRCATKPRRRRLDGLRMNRPEPIMRAGKDRRSAPLLHQILSGRRGPLVRLASVAVTLVAWEWYGRGVDPVFLSYPTAILAAVPAMFATGELPRAFGSSIL